MVKIPHSIEELCGFIFGLPYAGPCIPLLLCGALSVAAINQFTLGYRLFALAGVWALGHWWVSDPVKERRRLIGWHKAGSRAHLEALRSYRTWLWVGEIFFAAFIVVCLLWTHSTKMGFQRDQVAEKLSIKYEMPAGSDVLHSKFAIKNNSSFDISNKHQITCMVYLVVNESGFPLLSNMLMFDLGNNEWDMGGPAPFTPAARDSPIKAYGDEQTDSCLAAIKGPPIKCADIFVDFSYYLESQPNVQDHRERIVFTRDDSGNFGWAGQPKESKEDYCYRYLSSEGKSARDKQLKSGVSDFSKDDFWVARR